MSSPMVSHDNPADPEAAALELIQRIPGDQSWVPPLDVRSALASLLFLKKAFVGLSWHDAKHAAVAIVVDLSTRDDASAFLRHRAMLAASGDDNMTWGDRVAMVRAFNIAAEVVEL